MAAAVEEANIGTAGLMDTTVGIVVDVTQWLGPRVAALKGLCSYNLFLKG